MTRAEDRAKARWGMNRPPKPEHIRKAEKAGAEAARRFFAAEGRRAKRLHDKQQRAKAEPPEPIAWKPDETRIALREASEKRRRERQETKP